jgi:hypothetical protein
VAEHIAQLSDERYVQGFYDYLKGGWGELPSDISRFCRQVNSERAMSEGAGGTSTTAGGYMVPPFLDPAIILTNVGVSNPFRGIATIKTITTATWKGVTSAGVTAEWTAESSEMTDASPTVAQPTITPVRADCYIQASFEMIEDTNLTSELAMLFADARDRLEGTAFAWGTGSTQPRRRLLPRRGEVGPVAPVVDAHAGGVGGVSAALAAVEPGGARLVEAGVDVHAPEVRPPRHAVACLLVPGPAVTGAHHHVPGAELLDATPTLGQEPLGRLDLVGHRADPLRDAEPFGAAALVQFTGDGSQAAEAARQLRPLRCQRRQRRSGLLRRLKGHPPTSRVMRHGPRGARSVS